MNEDIIEAEQSIEKPKRKKRKKLDIKDIPIHKRFIYCLEDFLNDIECIIDMFKTVIPILDKQNNDRKSHLNNLKTKLTLFSPEYIKSNVASKKDIIFMAIDLINTLKKLDRGLILFKNNIIISLVSRYDEYLANLISLLMELNPEPLYNPDKTLNLTEIMELGSLERIRDKFIEKEVEKVIRESHTKHFEYLEKRLEIPLRKDLPIWPYFIELTQRRHLLAHCGGIVSTQYLKICLDNKIELDKIDKKIKQGERIRVSNKYIENSFLIIYEIGFKLGQTIFRKKFDNKDYLEQADSSLANIGYQHLKQCNWKQATMIFEYGIKLQNNWISSDNYNKLYNINLCIALINSNNKERAMAILDKIDWSSASSKFILAVNVLRGEYAKAERIMSIMNGIEPISEEDFREWPLFNEFRKTENFSRAFKKIYGKEYDGLPTLETLN